MMKERFPYLKLIVKISQVLAWLWLAVSFLVFFVILVGNIDVAVLGIKVDTKAGWGLFGGSYYLAYGVLGFIVISGVGDLLLLLLSIEENLRKKE